MPASTAIPSERTAGSTQPSGEGSASADGQLSASPWRTHDTTASTAGIGRMVSAMPGFARITVELAWRSSPTATIAVLVLQLLSAAATAFGLVGATQVLARLLNSGQLGDRLLAALPALAAVAASYAAAGLVNAGVTAAEARLAPGVRRLAEDDLVTAAAHVELESFDDPEFHDALVRARDRGVQSLDRAVLQLVQLAAAGVSLLAIGSVVGTLHPLLLIALVVSMVPTGWATVRMVRLEYAQILRSMPGRRRQQQLRELLTERAPAVEVRSYTAQSFLLKEYRRVAGELERIEVQLGWKQARVEVTGRLFAGLGVTLAYGLLLWLVLGGGVTAASAGATVLAMQASRAALSRAAIVLNMLYEQSLYVRDFGAFRRDARARRRVASATRAPQNPHEIAVVNASFRYPGAATDSLRNVSVSLQRGQVLALVGENGSGKSTLAKLLAGLYSPCSGAVAWDGVDLAGVEADTVRGQVALVSQDPTNWPLTAEQSILLGRPDELRPDGVSFAAAARASGADAVVARLSGGWNTLLCKDFSGGAELSAGQWQRLAVARALYRDAPLLICDEPTARLDPRAEALVYDTLRRLAGGRTVVLITHRLSSVRLADRIAVLREGELVELGTHAELMTLSGYYAELYNLQART
jgi:ATP-binding cassette subfamily B protein